MSLQGSDLASSEVPTRPTNGVKALNPLLRKCGVTVFGAADLAAAYRPEFPRPLGGAPFRLPTGNTALRRSLNRWFDAENLKSKYPGENRGQWPAQNNRASATVFFVTPSAVEEEIERQYDVEAVRRIDSVRERFYAITEYRKRKHPAVNAILESCQPQLKTDPHWG